MGDINTIIRIGASPVETLTTQFGIQNIKPIQGNSNNPYLGKLPSGPTPDPALYMGVLGTPIFSDLTLGDTANSGANTYTDNNGILRTFQPMTFATVLMTINQAKNQEKTKIQGRDGTIKEYIGLGDYIVTINGILPGSNGVYPRDDVAALKQILAAPLALVATSWWLQLFDISYLVIDDFGIPQLPGEQSQQSFSLHTSSDALAEIQFIPGANA
jgi:hypothetical protein